MTNKHGIIKFVNDTFCERSKYKEELIDRYRNIIDLGYQSNQFFKHLWKPIGNSKVWKGVITIR